MSRTRNVLVLVAPLLLLAVVATPRLLARFRPLRPHAVSCAPCFFNTCPLQPGQIAIPIKTTIAWWCLDYDNIPPGHCSKIPETLYHIVDQNGDLVGSCVIDNCQGTPDNSRPCAHPRFMGGGDFGNYSVSGSGQSAPNSDTCKGDPTK